MAETKKGSQGTGSTGGRGRGAGSGATDPNPETANLGGASSSITTGGTGSATTSGTTGGMGAGTTGTGGGSRATGTSGGAMGGSTTGTAGTHDMGVSASQHGGGGAGSGLMDQVRSSASDTFQTVKSNTTAKLEEQKSTLSTGLLTVADNIRQLGSNLSGGQQKDPLTRFAADYSQTAADKLRTAADYFNTHDVETMYRDVEGMARRNPAVFVGGAFAIGFLAARFLKSSSPRGERGYGSSGNAMMSRGTESTRMPRLNTGGGTSNTTAI